MKRDHTKLICDVGELSGLFTDTRTLEAFLQKIVEMISEHMRSEVCSIYLYYEDIDQLVLKATKGLHPSSAGEVKMKLGEGLTGLALKELKAICERNASSKKNFKHFPGIGEEKFESFLAVPIVRGQTKIGVMVIQNSQKNYFKENDIKAFKAVTFQLANTIETAKLLMSLNERRPPEKENSPLKTEIKFIKGLVGSPGFAFAKSVAMAREGAVLSLNREFDSFLLEDFYRAVSLTEKQLEDFQKQIEERLADVASLIFTAQILMLKDKSFIDAMVELIKQGMNPPLAIVSVVKSYVEMFAKISNPFLREKNQDVRDIGSRLLKNLTGVGEKTSGYEGRIVIAEELFPSDALKLSTQKVAGMILLSGGVSSHLSILARSLGVPLVISATPELLNLPDDTDILLDGEQGNIYINPANSIVKTFMEKESAHRAIAQLKDSVTPVTHTKDGVQIKLLANINLLGDVPLAREFKAEGIGLYRTEFPFIVRSDFPLEEEQYIIYKKLVGSMPECEITFRTLDIGGDKVLSYYHHGKEENPFLGMRSIRFSLKHKDIFSQQLRAILRAGTRADLRIMFPMISSLDEFLEAKEMVTESIAFLQKEKISCHPRPAIGMMIELPCVLEIIEDFAREADFFSIGTNDFIQYMLAVDRTNEKVAEFYLPHHPSILRAFRRIVEAANRHKKEVSICGDMAHDERYIGYFLGIGITRLSLDPRYLPKIQKAISLIELRKARKEAEVLLGKAKIKEVAEHLISAAVTESS